jgi:hypothetical protein
MPVAAASGHKNALPAVIISICSFESLTQFLWD